MFRNRLISYSQLYDMQTAKYAKPIIIGTNIRPIKTSYESYFAFLPLPSEKYKKGALADIYKFILFLGI